MTISSRIGVYSLSGEEIIRHVRNKGKTKEASPVHPSSPWPRRLREMEDVKALMTLTRLPDDNAQSPSLGEKVDNPRFFRRGE